MDNVVDDVDFEPVVLIGTWDTDDDGNWVDWDGSYWQDVEGTAASYGVASIAFDHARGMADVSIPAGVGKHHQICIVSANQENCTQTLSFEEPEITAVSATGSESSEGEIDNGAVILIPTDGVGALIELSGTNFGGPSGTLDEFDPFVPL